MKNRKQDHIDLSFEAQVGTSQLDPRFYYEPLNDINQDLKFEDKLFGGRIAHPLWISSMTGGLTLGKTINVNLAKVAAKHKLGMGLGSCRVLLHDDSRIEDFDVRKYIGDQPLFANLGIAQISELRSARNHQVIGRLIDKLEADGLIVHINPLQEFAQPEGKLHTGSPIELIKWLLDKLDIDIIVKEVGQGIGPHGLNQLMSLPLKAIDTAAAGGTNFALLELLRADSIYEDALHPLALVGHSAEEMVDFINDHIYQSKADIVCDKFILSGGVKSFLDGYYLINKLQAPALYGQAANLLKYAKSSFEEIDRFVSAQLSGYQIAAQLLKVK